MTFSQIPPQYAPLGAEVPYAVEHSAAEDLDIRITDRNGSTLYGTLRFVASAAARFDAAPFLRRAARRLRPCGQQKSRPEGRLKMKKAHRAAGLVRIGRTRGNRTRIWRL